jgi:hypothetical protein
LLHAMRKHGVSGRGEDRDSGQHKIFTNVHWGFRWWRSFLKLLTTEIQMHQADKRKKQDNQ